MAPAEGNGSTGYRELQGWKEIADYLNRSVRTAQRWEREFDLPVRRLRTATGETVFAVAGELDDWKARFTRKEGFSGEPDEGNDNGEAQATAGGAGAVTPVAPAPTPSVRTGGRRWLLGVGISLLLVALAAAAFAVRARNGGTVDAGPVDALAAVLDPGPWPTHAHDLQRTNRSHLAGPRKASTPVPIYRLRGDFVATADPVVTMDGHILLGWCGEVVGLSPDGREEWVRSLVSANNGIPVHPSGFAAGGNSTVYYTGADCLNSRDLIETRLYSVTTTGAPAHEEREIGSSYVAPAIGPDRSIYTLDEVAYLRAFRPWMDAAWGTTLGGFVGTGIAVDGHGNLYVGTDGGVTHEWSLWSVDRNGEIRWKAIKEPVSQPLLGKRLVYVSTPSGTVYAYALDGHPRWSQFVGAVSSIRPLALAASGVLYVQTGKELVALDGERGTLKWRRGNGACGLGAHPIVDRDDNIYLPFGDFVVSFTADGTERWRVAVPRPVTLVLGDHRRLYVISAERTLYVINEQ